VGLAGLPPHVHSLVAGPVWALAEPNEPSAVARTALAATRATAFVCLPVFISTPSIVDAPTSSMKAHTCASVKLR
jgi:hypothetical protein